MCHFTPITINPQGYFNPYISRKRYTFNDKRLEKVRLSYEKSLIKNCSASIQEVSDGNTEAVSFYRFLNNKRVSHGELIQKSCEIDPMVIKGRKLLVFGDTTNISLKHQYKNLGDTEKVGVLDDNKTPGFHAHVNLVADSSNGNIFGTSDIMFWSRSKIMVSNKPRNCYKTPFEKRESYRWNLGVSNSLNNLESAKQSIFVFDREADSFEIFEWIIKEKKSDFIIRGNYNRKIIWHGKEMRVSECMQQTEVIGTYKIVLPPLNHRSKTARKRITRQKRTATIELRAEVVTVLPPAGLLEKKEPLVLTLVEAREIDVDLPEGQEPILWRLWTTLPVNSEEQAKEIIKYYTWRWNIEQLFRLIKKQGFNIEATNLKSFDAIIRQTIMILKSASRVLQLTSARDNKNAQPIGEVFNKEEVKVLEKLNTKLEGKTEKLKNKNPKQKLSWATWIIARLGGWKGYKSQRPPGPIILKRGLDKFSIYMDAAKVFDSG